MFYCAVFVQLWRLSARLRVQTATVLKPKQTAQNMQIMSAFSSLRCRITQVWRRNTHAAQTMEHRVKRYWHCSSTTPIEDCKQDCCYAKRKKSCLYFQIHVLVIADWNRDNTTPQSLFSLHSFWDFVHLQAVVEPLCVILHTPVNTSNDAQLPLRACTERLLLYISRRHRHPTGEKLQSPWASEIIQNWRPVGASKGEVWLSHDEKSRYVYTQPRTHRKKLLSELLSRLFLFQLIGYRIIVDYHTRNVLILKIERPPHQGLFRSASNYAFQKMHPSSSLKIPAALLIVRLTT